MLGPIEPVQSVSLHSRGPKKVPLGQASAQTVHSSVHSTVRSSVQPSEELIAADESVKVHENSHLAVLGGFAAGPINYNYITLPDGSKFAVGGSIKVDLNPVPGDPEATIRKARAIANASFAVNSPSPADMQVAAQAYQMEMQAQRELDQKRQASSADQQVDITIGAPVKTNSF